MQEVLLARQAIYDKDQKTVSYELLFRTEESNRALFDPTDSKAADLATANVVTSAFADSDIDEIIGDKQAFIKFTRNLLLNLDTRSLAPERVIIEVDKFVDVGDKLLEKIRELKESGFTIAVDYKKENESLQKVFEFASYIKVSVLDFEKEELQEIVKKFEDADVKLLAEKVEDHEMFEFCKECGFNLFQGFFLSKPNMLKGQNIASNRSITLQLLAQLQNPDVILSDIEDIIVKDSVLSYKLLRIINSSAYGLGRKIESIREAIIHIGLKALRNWVTMMVLSNVDDKPIALLEQTIIRAKMCEMIAQTQHRTDVDQFSTVGLLSTLDALLDCEMRKLLQTVPLVDEINDALLHHDNHLGEVLDAVVKYEEGNWNDITLENVSLDDISNAYYKSIGSAKETMSALGLNS